MRLYILFTRAPNRVSKGLISSTMTTLYQKIHQVTYIFS
jgi:hypothetical protein